MERWLVAAVLALGGCDEAKSTAGKDAPAAEKDPAATEKDPTAVEKESTAQAERALTSLVDATASYFMEEHVGEGGAVVSANGALVESPSHNCPSEGAAKGTRGPTPPLSLDCSKGCTPAADPKEDGEYDAKVWDDPIWTTLRVRPKAGHRTHYAFEWDNAESGYGECRFKITVTTDMAAKRVATEVVGTLDEKGLKAGKPTNRAVKPDAKSKM